MKKPLVSICLTTYNRADSLSLTIDSILNQQFSDFELIISDDNSTDNTSELCKAYCSRDPRVMYYRNIENLKMPGNLNKAISYASGDFIANLHDGDIYKPELISKWIELLLKHPEALFVFNQYNSLDESGKIIIVYDHKLAEVNEGLVLMKYFLNTLTSAPWGTVMARKNAYEKFGFFNKNYGFISDVEMWLRLGLSGKVCYVNQPLIDLTPREKNHLYFLPNWKIFCLNATILLEYYPLYEQSYPGIQKTYPLDTILKKIEDQALHNMAILLKNRSFKGVRQGIAIFRELPLKRLNRIGSILSLIGIFPVEYKSELCKLKQTIIEIRG